MKKNNKQSRQTHCKRGHEFTEENTRIDSKGSRVCRACQRLRYVKVEKSNICKAGLHSLLEDENVGYQHGRRFCRPCRDIKAAEWRKRNVEYARASRYRTEYGITIEQFEEMLKKQEGRCAICRNEFVSTRATHIDHCHTKNKVRELLCGTCNSGLGMFKDDPELLSTAIKYLEKHNDC